MMKFDPSRTDAGASEGSAALARLALVIGAGLTLLFLVATMAGYLSVVIEEGDPQARDLAIVGALVLAIGGIGYATLWGWRRMGAGERPSAGPGEERTRQRQRRQTIYIGFGVLVGGIVGFVVGFFDEGSGNLFAGDWEELSLPPALAIAIAAGLLFGFLALPLWGFRMIDDYKREHNLVAFTGGCLAVISGFPVWAALHAGGLVPPPHAFGMFAIAYIAMLASFLFARWRL
jgi:putative flippase GtrA